MRAFIIGMLFLIAAVQISAGFSKTTKEYHLKMIMIEAEKIEQTENV